jgi:hypothetical protein
LAFVWKDKSCHRGFLENDERVHPYQRGRASITGLGLDSG